MPICKIIEINAQPEVVFPWVADPEKSRQWLPNVESTVFAGDPTRVGTTFVQRIKESGRVNEYNGEVTGYAKDRWYAVRLEGKTFTVEADYRFEPGETGGTKLTFTCEIPDPTFITRAFMFIFSGFAQRLLQQPMEKLKSLVESGEPAGGGWNRGPGRA